MKKIAIIGAGNIGSAIGGVLEKNKNLKVLYWDKDASKLKTEIQLSDVVSNADFLFLCVPSWAQREVVPDILLNLKASTGVISLSKGIEKETLKTMDVVLAEMLPSGHRFALCLGPMISEEIAKDIFTVGVLATEDKSFFNKIDSLFEYSNLKFEYSKDVRGSAIASVLKNIYTLGLGLLDGLSLGDNTKGWFVTKAISEISEIIELLEGKKETAFTLSGIGDLVTTGFSAHSRNRKVGYKIASGEVCSLDSEGVTSLDSVVKLLGENLEKFPILNILDKIINKNEDPKLILMDKIQGIK